MYLGLEKSQINPWVYVDDSDPSITYSTTWLVDKGLATDLSALTDPDSINTPLYGTLHSTSSGLIRNETYTFWYLFNGTDFAATFRGGDASASLSTKCRVDGVKQTIDTIPGAGGTLCWNEKPLSAQTHNLSVSFTHFSETILSFDGLAFNASTYPQHGADMIYFISDSEQQALLKVGGTFQFQFDGVSVGIYGNIVGFNDAPSPGSPSSSSTLSYTIDSGEPVIFTIEKPAQGQSNLIFSQLILQTPPLSHGPHTLTLTTHVPGSLQDFFALTAIVQNTTQPINLTPVPSISSSISFSTSSSLSTSHRNTSSNAHIDFRIIMGIALGTSMVILLILLWLCRRRIRKRAVMERNKLHVAVDPFSPPDPAQIGRRRFMLAQYVTTEKTNKYRQAFGIGINITISDGENQADEYEDGQPRRVRYRVHEDGGEVINVEGGEASDDDGDVISLPPIYDDTVAHTRHG